METPLVRPAIEPPGVAIVLGCGEVGSATAVALAAAGLAVVLVDEADPAWHRRGMALADAWYVGNAELAGAAACFCASLKSIPSVLERGLIAATTWSWAGVAAMLPPSVIVDARRSTRRRSVAFRGRAPLTIGVDCDGEEAEGVDVVVSTTTAARQRFADAPFGDAVPLRRAFPRGAPPPVAVPGAAGTVRAERRGRFATDLRVGDTVVAGATVGGLAGSGIVAPLGGVLLGIAARGARIDAGDPLVEVVADAGRSQCFGIAPEARHVADAVAGAVVGTAAVPRRRVAHPAPRAGCRIPS